MKEVVLPPIISQQWVVYDYQCDLCDAEYVGYTSQHLFQRTGEHCYSAIGKHLKNDLGRPRIHRKSHQQFFRFEEVQRNIGLSDL